MSLETGQMAPDFTLKNQNGEEVTLSDFRGKKNVVLVFYPGDDTPVCTKQLNSYNHDLSEFVGLDAQIVAISPQDVASHEKFRSKYSLDFPLLADTEHTVTEAYGVWKEKSMYGRKVMGIERSTFLIDADGKVRRAFGDQADALPQAVALDDLPGRGGHEGIGLAGDDRRAEGARAARGERAGANRLAAL